MDISIFSSHPMIDFHTHQAMHLERSDVLEIVSSTTPSDVHVFSLERHPWHTINPLNEAEKLELSIQLKHSNCLALGEIGLDKQKGVDFEQQIEILRSILSVANDEKMPVIIHCVRAFDEIIQLKKEFKRIPNWAIHGFNKNWELAKQLIDHGFYLSLNCGKANQIEKLVEVIQQDRLFLETDNSAILIEDNYLRAAGILEMSVVELQSQIAQNAKTFFEHE